MSSHCYEVIFLKMLRNLSISRALMCFVYIALIAFMLSRMSSFFYPSFMDDKQQEQCVCGQSNANSAVIYLEKPRRSYHGNHWYHIGEYFLSRRKVIQNLVQRSNFSLVQLIAYDPHLSDMITPFTFFMIMLTLQSSTSSSDQLKSIELYRPLTNSHMKRLKRLLPRKACNVESEYSMEAIDRNYFNSSCSSGGQSSHSWAPFSFHSPTPPLYTFATALHPSLIDSTVFSLSRRSYGTFDTSTPFLASASVSSSSDSDSASRCHCGQYLGRVGHIPLNSSEWFSDPSEAVAIQRTADTLCEAVTSYHPYTEGDLDIRVHQRAKATATTTAGSSGRVFKLVIYERDKNRKFSDLQGMLRDIKGVMDTSMWDIDIIYHSESINPCKLQKVMATADVFLTSHGFQCIALMFMKRGSTLIEIFPYKYFKPTYIPLCAAFGIHHRHVSNQEPSSYNSRVLQIRTTQQCMADIMCRSFARHQNVLMPPDHIQLVVKTMRQVQSR